MLLFGDAVSVSLTLPQLRFRPVGCRNNERLFAWVWCGIVPATCNFSSLVRNCTIGLIYMTPSPDEWFCCSVPGALYFGPSTIYAKKNLICCRATSWVIHHPPVVILLFTDAVIQKPFSGCGLLMHYNGLVYQKISRPRVRAADDFPTASHVGDNAPSWQEPARIRYFLAI